MDNHVSALHQNAKNYLLIDKQGSQSTLLSRPQFHKYNNSLRKQLKEIKLHLATLLLLILSLSIMYTLKSWFPYKVIGGSDIHKQLSLISKK